MDLYWKEGLKEVLKTFEQNAEYFEEYRKERWGNKDMSERYEAGMKEDVVLNPSHYCIGGIETIDYIRAKLTPEEFAGYCKGNVIKYVSRAEYKGKESEDLKKANVYLGWLIERSM